MTRLFAGLLLVATSLFAEYKLEKAGAPPSGVAQPIAAMLNSEGHKVVAGDGKVWCEVWFVKESPKAPETSEVDVTWKTVPPGSIIGVLHFPEEGADRRAQAIQPGVYTLRFSMFPINGDHQGVAPQRDFLVLTPAANDKEAAPVDSFDALMKMSRAASGTPHPAVLSMWLEEFDFNPGLHEMGEEDWVLQTKIGEAQISLILVGKATE